MKKELLKSFTILVLLGVIALATNAATVKAQSPNKVVADIPFAFSVGYKTMPAGEYSVQTMSNAGAALLIRSADGKTSALRLSEAAGSKKNTSNARLVFHRYGERYFLAQVWAGADTADRQLLESQEERAIESELAKIASKSGPSQTDYEIVEVVAVLR